MSYIVKSCPAYCYLGKECHNEEGQYGASCCEVTNCVIKQIVEKCKRYIENYNDKVFYDEDDVKILMGKVMLSQSILSEFLETQEVE